MAGQARHADLPVGLSGFALRADVRPREGAPEEADQPRLAGHAAARSLRYKLGQARGVHDLVADTLLGVHADRAARERRSIPGSSRARRSRLAQAPLVLVPALVERLLQ